MVKEIITLNGDVSSFVPPTVAMRLLRKMKLENRPPAAAFPL